MDCNEEHQLTANPISHPDPPAEENNVTIENILSIPSTNNIIETISDDDTDTIRNVVDSVIENISNNASGVVEPSPEPDTAVYTSPPAPETAAEPAPEQTTNHYDPMFMAPAAAVQVACVSNINNNNDNNDEFNEYIKSIDVADIPSLRIPLHQFIHQVRHRIAWKTYMVHLNRRIPYSAVCSTSAQVQGWANINDKEILDLYGDKYFSFVCQNDSEELLEVCRAAMIVYKNCGMNGRSSKIVDLIHTYISRKVTEILPDNDLYSCKLEKKVVSVNSSGFKRCDIVVYKNNNPYIILPFKLIRTSYAKNRNNYLENLTGELVLLISAAQRAGRELYIVPINIIFDTIVDRDRNNVIRHIEKINYDNTFKIYEELSSINITNNGITSPLVYDSISYILNVQDSNLVVGSVWNGVVVPVSLDASTPYRSWEEILMNLLND